MGGSYFLYDEDKKKTISVTAKEYKQRHDINYANANNKEEQKQASRDFFQESG